MDIHSLYERAAALLGGPPVPLLSAVVVERCPVEVPDHEFGRVATYRGCCVRDRETGCYCGDIWKDDRGWCWRSLGGEHYGHADTLRLAVMTLALMRKALYQSCGVGA